MKITALLASPRPNGNSAAVANRFIAQAQQAGDEVETFNLNYLSYKGCQGCLMCKTKLARCMLKDDLTPVLESVAGADVVVMASPIYWYDINSQLKAFIDRAFAFMKPDYLTNPEPSSLAPGKTAVLILAQGTDDDRSDELWPKYRHIFRRLGFSDSELIYATGVREAGQAEARPDIMDRVDQVYQEIADKQA